ncbi:MAG: hypothetical protein VCE74_04205, partial [Alphaproteobacteria bacterium]
PAPAGEAYFDLLYCLFILTYPKYQVTTSILVSKKFGIENKLADLYGGCVRFCVELLADHFVPIPASISAHIYAYGGCAPWGMRGLAGGSRQFRTL